MNYCYLNGKIIPLKKASINIYDIGFLRGYAVFDYIKMYEGKPFLLEEHLIRLDNSAKRLGLVVPLSHKEIIAIIYSLIKKNKAGTGAIRIVLSGGVTHGLEWNRQAPTFAILLEPAPSLPAELYSKGGKLITTQYDRYPFDAKHTNYSFAVSMQEVRKKAKAVEILYLWKDQIREATTSNIFIVKKGKIFTPKDSMLFGITRNFVIKLAKQEFQVIEKVLKLSQVLEADECFITASNKEVLPIVKVDGTVIGNGKVGPVSKRLITLYQDAIKNL